MTYSIGPMDFRYLTAHNWSASQPNVSADVLLQPQTGFPTSQQMISYNLIGAFSADTPTEARLQRKQLNDLVNNAGISQIFIVFDQDDAELSGWFVLVSLETTVNAAIFTDYTFSLSVRKLKGGGYLTAQAWKSFPYNHAYTNTFETWLSLPNDRRKPITFELRVGADGGNNPIRNDLFEGDPVLYTQIGHSMNFNSDIYKARCQIYDTITSSTTADPTNPSESSWIERFGSYVSFEGDVVFRNNLLMYIWDETLGSKLYLWTGANWEIVCNSFTLGFSDSPTVVTERRKPTVEYFDFNKIIWYENFTEDENRNISIRYKMLRGSYTLHVAIKTDHGDLLSTSGITKYSGNSHSSYDEDLGGSNYRAALGTTTLANAVQYGFFYTDGSTGGGSSGAIQLGYVTNEKVWTRLGLFGVPDPIPNSVTLKTLASQYLANMNFQETILNPIITI